jgi:hypothetical protein
LSSQRFAAVFVAFRRVILTERVIASPRSQREVTPMRAAQDIPQLDQLLTEIEAAQLRRQSVRTLQAERSRGDGCRFVKLGRSVRYRRRDVLEFIETNVRASTTEADMAKAGRDGRRP